MTIEIPKGYEALGEALAAAVEQAAAGKGAGRHSYDGELFSDQLIFEIPRRLGEGGECFCLGQAVKKIYESRRLEPAHARAELLGAINYLAAAWRLLGGAESVSASEGREAPLFSEGTPVEFLPGECDVWEPAMYRGLDSDGRHLVAARGGVLACVPADRIRKPEDAGGAPFFYEGEQVEFRLRDGKWKPAGFLCMDGNFAIVVSEEGKKIRIPACDVRPAEKS